MSADQKTLDDNSKRRGGRLRREADAAAEAVDNYEANADLETEGDDEEVDSGKGITERKGRATPGRRALAVEETKSEGNAVTRPLMGIRDYFEGVRSEMQKVVWPTREETRRLTFIVLGVTISAALALGVITLVFNELFTLGLRSPLVFGILFVVILGAYVYYLRSNNRRTPTY
ncbi:MAG TPA: preprotein translocase subunit SecE [Phototrophicaceae bacterium]|nr:preprotein translocase subunit SecE [Phototrophicaceae bacterium]